MFSKLKHFIKTITRGRISLAFSSGEPLNPTNIEVFTNKNDEVLACTCTITRDRIIFCFFNSPLPFNEYKNIKIRHDFNRKTQIVIPKSRIPVFQQILTEVKDVLKVIK